MNGKGTLTLESSTSKKEYKDCYFINNILDGADKPTCTYTLQRKDK